MAEGSRLKEINENLKILEEKMQVLTTKCELNERKITAVYRKI